MTQLTFEPIAPHTSMTRFTNILAGLAIIVIGCAPRTPSNAVQSERVAINSLGNKVSYVRWDDDGHVYGLNLSQRILSSRDCADLGQLSGLVELDLSSCQIDKACFGALEGLPHLRSLSLAFIELDDEELHRISRLKSLRYLVLDHSTIDDDGINHLAALQELKHLWIQNTAVSAEGANELRRRLPNCVIQR